MAHLLLNVKSVSSIDTRRLHNIIVVHGAGVLLHRCRGFVALPLAGLARCDSESRTENGSRLYATTVTALLSEPFDVCDRHVALLLECIDGSRFLLGNAERPYMAISVGARLPDKVTEASGYTFTAELTDRYGLMPVLD